MSTIPAFQAHSTVASAMLGPDFSRQIREAQQAMTAPAVRSAQEILDWNLFLPIRETPSAVLQTQEILDRMFQPMRETASAVLRAHESVGRALSHVRLVFDQVLEFRRQIGELLARFNPFQRPANVSGLEDQLAGLRRRSIEAASAAHVQLRALLGSRSQQGPPPGGCVTTQPQVTRGPNTRRSIAPNQPAGLVRV